MIASPRVLIVTIAVALLLWCLGIFLTNLFIDWVTPTK